MIAFRTNVVAGMAKCALIAGLRCAFPGTDRAMALARHHGAWIQAGPRAPAIRSGCRCDRFRRSEAARSRSMAIRPRSPAVRQRRQLPVDSQRSHRRSLRNRCARVWQAREVARQLQPLPAPLALPARVESVRPRRVWSRTDEFRCAPGSVTAKQALNPARALVRCSELNWPGVPPCEVQPPEFLRAVDRASLPQPLSSRARCEAAQEIRHGPLVIPAGWIPSERVGATPPQRPYQKLRSPRLAGCGRPARTRSAIAGSPSPAARALLARPHPRSRSLCPL